VNYCDLDLLDHVKLPSGMRLIRQGQHLRALEVYHERLARRGGDTRRKAMARAWRFLPISSNTPA
jgi:hypothetical protein